MMLAELLARAGGVEVAEGDELQPVNLLIPLEHLLEHQLGFAVGIDRALRQILGHRHAVGRAVGGAGGAEDELLHAALDGGVEQLEAVGDVVVEVLARVGHGFADQRVGGEVHDGVGPGLLDGVQDVVLLLRAAQDEPCPRVHRRAMALAEIVIHRDLDGRR